mmetsp:Transcript_30002/g.49819  ORF Transcript_30002/g.49819 Transcript_30002/m.49819 type:complete len:102 (-) Transcript_30002:1438-1743(-)
MKIAAAAIAVALLSSSSSSIVVHAQEEKCVVPGTLTCQPIGAGTSTTVARLDSAPVLDGDLSEWTDVAGGITTDIRDIWGSMYDLGEATYKCVYDSEKIYL